MNAQEVCEAFLPVAVAFAFSSHACSFTAVGFKAVENFMIPKIVK